MAYLNASREKHEGQTFGLGYDEDQIIQGDSLFLFKQVKEQSVDLVLSDIPYGIGFDEWDVIHNNTNSALLGSSPAQKNAGAVFKKRGKPINGWSEADKRMPHEYQEWCALWAADCLRSLKPGGSAFIFAGRRFSHRCICAFEDVGFNLKDQIAWLRAKAPHRAQRVSKVYERRSDQSSADEWAGWRLGNLRPTFEPILWFVKPYPVGTTIADNVKKYSLGAFNQKSWEELGVKPDNVVTDKFRTGESGFHPTQKSIELMSKIISLVTVEGQLVLDPFAGSGSTLVAAKELNRRYLGFEANSEYVSRAKKRLSSTLI